MMELHKNSMPLLWILLGIIIWFILCLVTSVFCNEVSTHHEQKDFSISRSITAMLPVMTENNTDCFSDSVSKTQLASPSICLAYATLSQFSLSTLKCIHYTGCIRIWFKKIQKCYLFQSLYDSDLPHCLQFSINQHTVYTEFKTTSIS